jgi:hypothetical protein
MLEVDNVSLRYGAAVALKGVSLAAWPGRITCLLGPQRRRQDQPAARGGRAIIRPSPGPSAGKART